MVFERDKKEKFGVWSLEEMSPIDLAIGGYLTTLRQIDFSPPKNRLCHNTSRLYKN
jgi:hypothetical protein